jgi:hypothetical protein
MHLLTHYFVVGTGQLYFTAGHRDNFTLPLGTGTTLLYRWAQGQLYFTAGHKDNFTYRWAQGQLYFTAGRFHVFCARHFFCAVNFAPLSFCTL